MGAIELLTEAREMCRPGDWQIAEKIDAALAALAEPEPKATKATKDA